MLNVIIADDEPIIRNGIAQTIPWEKYNCTVTAVVRNGLEALEQVKSSHVDVVISDIKMPKMDGLELLLKAKELCPDIFFIIISGYDDFLYVQKALNAQAFGYLLKPLALPELEEMIGRIALRSGERMDPVPVADAKPSAVTREQFLMGYLSGLTTGPGAGQSSGCAQSEEAKKSHCVFCMQSRVDGSASPGALIQCTEDILKSLSCEFIVYIHESCVLLILSASDANTLKNDCDKFSRMWLASDRAAYAFLACGGMGEGLSGLDESCRLAERTAVYQRYFLPEAYCEGELEAAYSGFELETGVSRGDIALLTLAGKRTELKKSLADFGHIRCGTERLKTLLETAVLICVDAVSFSGPGKYRRKEFNDCAKYRQRIAAAATDCAAVEEALKIADELLDITSLICTQDTYMIVERTKAIVKLEYAQPDLTLASVAKRIGFNNAYLSHFFSTNAKQGFAEYLTRVRINKAKELLLTDIKISSVAEKVGYNSQPYFSTKFRAETGMTPSEYRENAKKRKYK